MRSPPARTIASRSYYALAADLRMSKQEMLRVMIREWLETGGYLPAPMLEEDGEVDGNA